MKALDTNILVRFLVNDDKKQARAVYKLFKQVESNQGTLFVPVLVILETIWVLESVYQISKHDVVDALLELVQMPILDIEKQSALLNALSLAQCSNFDLSDLLIGFSAKPIPCEPVLTFDKRAAKCELFELLI